MTHEEFKELCHSTKVYQEVEQRMRDIGGGTLNFDEIDKISSFDSFDKVIISGLKQDTFEYFIKTQAY